jgi:ribosomal protein S18 acetylase RimI-like enzyme
MPDVEIRPFSDEHLDAAAELLRERHERHLAAVRFLARDVDYRAQLEAEASSGAGVVACVAGELRAYLLGRVTDVDAVVGIAGCAAADPELLRDLHAALAPLWDRDRHRVYVPASDAALVDVCFPLAFGLQFTYAVRQPALAGHALLYRREPTDLRIPANSIDLALVVTAPDARGAGVGSALTTHPPRYAYEAGYDAVTIDWRVVNLLASRFFSARGFRPTFVRLYRHIP